MTEVRNPPPGAPTLAPDPQAGFSAEEPLGDILARLLDTGRAYADAEMDRQKLRVAVVGSGLRTVAILAATALILLFGTLVALMLGLVIALSPLLTPLGATACVAGISLLCVVLILLVARRRLRSLLKKATSP